MAKPPQKTGSARPSSSCLARVAPPRHPGVSATNTVAEREIRPSVVFRKVTGGFRSRWGPGVHAGYRSVTSTARLAGQTAFSTIRDIPDALFNPAARTA
jgi:hypothetical protein